MALGIEQFPGQREKERIILVLRRHWIVFLGHVILTFVWMIIPIIGFIFMKRGFPGFSESQLFPLLVLGTCLYYLFLLTYFYIGWLNYYLDVWIVTTDRIINIEQEGMFRRSVAEQNIYRVQDVTTEVRGMVETFFNFGDVLVQTAGQKDKFLFEQVPGPYEVKKIIIELNQFKLEQEPSGNAVINEDLGIPHNRDNVTKNQ